MPSMSGLYFDFEWLLKGLFHGYIESEFDNFPSLFENVDVVEITAEQYGNSWENLKKYSNNLRSAVVVRGIFKDSKAVREFGTNEWVDTYNNFSVKSIKKARDPNKYDYELQDETFTDFVAGIRRGEYKYGYGLDEIYTTYPELVSDLEIERFGRHDGQDYHFCSSITLFMSGTAKGLRWHNADHANFGFMIQGSKDFHLINPKYSMFMGPDGNRDPYSTGFAARSPMNIIDQIPQNTVRIHAGDAIFLPPWWWHAVETYGDDETGFAMLNTCRFGAIGASVKNNAVLELFRHAGFINWLHPKVPIIFRFVPYFRVLQDGIREYFNWMPRWDSMDCYSSKKKACESYFKSVGWEY